MRRILAGLLIMLAVTACQYNESDEGRHGGYGHGGYGGGGYYGDRDDYGYGSYYPYGRADYPRDRIWIIDGRHGCRYYPYQGYCYRYKDDYYRAIDWDRRHGYDDNWHQRRKDWCNKHDCRHDRNDHDDRYQDWHENRDGNVHRGVEKSRDIEKSRSPDGRQGGREKNRTNKYDNDGEDNWRNRNDLHEQRGQVWHSDAAHGDSDSARRTEVLGRSPARDASAPVIHQRETTGADWGGRSVPRSSTEQRAPAERKKSGGMAPADGESRGNTVPGRQQRPDAGKASAGDATDDQQKRRSRRGQGGEVLDTVEQ